jgi:diguanylate cyclase (GGDEF)-like protein
LTGLYNRRYFEERLDEEIHRSRRYDRPMSIIMIDIDFFKQFNDTCGHLKGDDVLRQLSHILQDHTRETDITARYGGEEFVMILPETSLESSRMLGERIRQAVDKAVFEGEERISAKKITVSIGVSCLTDDEGGYDALDRADRALYKSKQAGKNLVTVLAKEGLSQE